MKKLVNAKKLTSVLTVLILTLSIFSTPALADTPVIFDDDGGGYTTPVAEDIVLVPPAATPTPSVTPAPTYTVPTPTPAPVTPAAPPAMPVSPTTPTVTAPSASTITAPVTGQIVDPANSLTVRWTASSKAETYYIAVRDRTNDILLVSQYISSQSTSYTISEGTFQPGITVGIAIRANNSAGQQWAVNDVAITVKSAGQQPAVQSASVPPVAEQHSAVNMRVVTSSNTSKIILSNAAGNECYSEYTAYKTSGDTRVFNISYSFNGAGVNRQLAFVAVDSSGNRSAPYKFIITITQALAIHSVTTPPSANLLTAVNMKVVTSNNASKIILSNAAGNECYSEYTAYKTSGDTRVFDITYSFNGAGVNRQLAFVAIDSSGKRSVPYTFNISIINSASSTLAEMRARAEAIVNYTWVPTRDIKVWNENEYIYPDGTKSKTFIANKPVKGMPYTLFSSELGFDSLVSLEQYKNVAAKNYSATKKCVSTENKMRTGPAWGSCCATFVSEIFGGDFMTKYGNPRFDSCTALYNSDYNAGKEIGANLKNVKPGDALATAGHIIWISDITPTHLFIYEQAATDGAAMKRTIQRVIDKNGYLVYDGKTYTQLCRPKS